MGAREGRYRLSKKTAKPEMYHFYHCRRVLSYLHHTRHFGLVYNRAKMLRHCPNWVTCAVDSSFVVWYGGFPIAWECKRQPLVTMSTMESEYVAASRDRLPGGPPTLLLTR